VDRAALARLSPDGAAAAQHAPPRTALEERLAADFAELLGVARASILASFFDLGGHSLLATRLLSRLHGALGVELSLRRFFAEPTVAGLAREVEAALAQGARSVPAAPIRRAPRDRRPRLSFAQERLWLTHQLQPASAAYNVFLPVRLDGRLRVPVLERVLAEVLRRHEVLRTTLAIEGDGPVQVIAPESVADGWRLPVVDLSALPALALDAEASHRTLAEARLPFDLARGPLFRGLLLRLDADGHTLLMNLHHAVCDGWSLGILTSELGLLYGAFVRGLPSPLPALPVQYADYAEWQRDWLSGDVFRAQLDYWLGHLGGAPPVLDLPTDRARPRTLSDRGIFRWVALPPAVLSALGALAARRGTTLFVVLLAAFQTLLLRYTGQDRVSVGSPVANRTRVELEGLIGFFVNTLVLCTDLAGDPPFEALVERGKEVALGAFENQDLPFEKLVAQVQKDRDLSRQALFQVLFVLQNNQIGNLELPDVTVSILPPVGGLTQFDVVLSMEEKAGALIGSVSASADLFEGTTIARPVGHLERLLTGIAENPRCRLSELPLLSPEERQQVLVEWPLFALGGTLEGAAFILDPARRLVPIGVVGEVFVKPAAEAAPVLPFAVERLVATGRRERFLADGRRERRERGGTGAPAVDATAGEETERRKVEIEARRQQLSSRREQLSPERLALLRKRVGDRAATAPVPHEREEP
ncbi:MAG TPA: condensation domain-containing protein, partial [Thermoanaerobaculia bacterium]